MKKVLERIPMRTVEGEKRLELEKSGLGPRDCAAVFGADPHKSAFTLWAEKTGRLPPEEPGEAERFSRDNRDYIARRFSQETGKPVRRADAFLYNSSYPNSYADIHYLVLGENAGLTCECVSRLSLRRFQGKLYPSALYYSCLHCMMVTGRKKWYLAVLVPQKELKIFELHADPEELRCLAQGEAQFWRRVTEKCPPLPDGSPSTHKTLERLYPGKGEGSVDLSPISLQLHDYLRWQERMEEAKDAMDLRASTIKAFLGNSSQGHLGDIWVQWMPTGRLRLDLDRLQRECPGVDLARYQVFEQERAFTVCRMGEKAGADPTLVPASERMVCQ